MRSLTKLFACLLITYIFPLCVYAAPTISTLSPASGPVGGTNAVYIYGTGFVDRATVSFGGTNASTVYHFSQTELVAYAPAHSAGSVSVTVTNPDNRSVTLANAYRYFDAAPTITELSPASGPVGGTNAVYIYGTGFVDGATVSFGGTNASTVYHFSQTELVAYAPAHSVGKVSVTVTSPDLQSDTLENAYTYVDNSINSDASSIIPVIFYLLDLE